MSKSYEAPNVPDSKVTPEFVRDELLRCFESANREFAEALERPVPEDELKSQVKTFVQTVFSQCGVSYVSPTKAGIVAAIAECKSNAQRMMGPQGTAVIEHHYGEMMKLVDRLQG